MPRRRGSPVGLQLDRLQGFDWGGHTDRQALWFDGDGLYTDAVLRARGPLVDVTAFGADPTGVDDATDQIQAALDWASARGVLSGQAFPTVLLPAGRYLVSKTITLPAYAKIRGVGVGTYIEVPANQAAGFSVFRVTGATQNSFEIADLLIDGNGADQTEQIHGLDFNVATSAATYSQIRGVTIKEMSGYGIAARGTGGINQFRIIDCIIRDCYLHNVYLNTATQVDILNCTVRSAKTSQHGIVLDGAGVARVLIEGCRIEDNNLDGIRASQAAKVFVVGCVVNSNGQYGIYFDRVTWGQIVDNSVELSTQHGIFVDQGSHVHVSGNAVKANGRHGIYLAGSAGESTRHVVAANSVHENATGAAATYDGIHILNCSRNLVTANLVSQAGSGNTHRYGIAVLGGGSAVGNVVAGNELSNGGGTSNYNDAGTSTVRGWGNPGVDTIPTQVLTATATWDPANLAADGDVTSTTVTVTGAAAGDTVEATHDQQGARNVLVWGHVQAADTVRVVMMNKTGAGVDVGSGTVRVVVKKYA